MKHLMHRVSFQKVLYLSKAYIYAAFEIKESFCFSAANVSGPKTSWGFSTNGSLHPKFHSEEDPWLFQFQSIDN